MNVTVKAALVASFLGFSVWAPQANAAVITGVTVAATSSLGAPFNRFDVNTVNGSGTDFTTGFVSTDPSTMWLSNGNGAFGGAADTAPAIVYNLGAVYNVSVANIFNYNEASGLSVRGVHNAEVWAALSDGIFGFLGNIVLAQGSGLDSVNESQGVYIGTAAQFVSLRNLTAFVGADYGFVGLSEVSFDGTSIPTEVPEPATMALLGFGLLGAAAARKRLRATSHA